MTLPAARELAAGTFDAQRIIRPPGRHCQALLAIRRTISVAATLPAQWPTWPTRIPPHLPLQHVKTLKKRGLSFGCRDLQQDAGRFCLQRPQALRMALPSNGRSAFPNSSSSI